MNAGKKRFLFVRTFKTLKGGGPVPPLGLLYLGAAIRERFGDGVDVGIIDLGRMGKAEAAERVREWRADFVGLSAMSCEADVLRGFAALAKGTGGGAPVVLAGGPHAAVAGARLLDDPNVDVAVIGEAERTVVDFLYASADGAPLEKVRGIVFRDAGGKAAATEPAAPVEDLDSLPFPAWDLIDYRGYARCDNWNGALKEKFYGEILTSRGCPYGCRFCHNIFGKKVRLRSPENVLEELRMLYRNYGFREIHVVDDIFNVDEERAKRICELIAGSGMRLSLAFPNGLRADLMTKELVRLLKKAGTYRIHYGFETASERLQKLIGKNLDVRKAAEAFETTSRAGIMTGAYFMVGFPEQTRDEIVETIDFAARSPLDAAYFFKATPYPGSGFYEEVCGGPGGEPPESFDDYHFYSAGRSYGAVGADELNELMLLAQRKFFFSFRRMWRVFLKTPRKRHYIRKLPALLAIILQTYLLGALADGKKGGASRVETT
ncbi:MAG: radical SAM protein [bacterium]